MLMNKKLHVSSTKGKILVDATVCLCSYLVSLVIGLGAVPDPRTSIHLLLVAPAIVFARIVSFHLVSVYRIPWRYVSASEAATIIKGVLPVTIAWLAGRLFVPAAWPLLAVPLRVIALESVLVLTGILGVRIAARRRHERSNSDRPEPKRRKMLLVGLNDEAEKFIREWRRKDRQEADILGLVDDDPAAGGSVIHGVRVLGNERLIPEAVKTLQIDEAVITMPDLPPEDERRIMRAFRGTKVRVSRLRGGLELLYDGSGVPSLPLRDVEEMACEQLALFRTLTGRDYDPASEARYPVQHAYEVNKPFSDPEGLSGDLLVAAGTMVKLLRLPAGAAVLDLGCGCGWTSIVLARCGFRVTALDLNAASLATAMANARAIGVDVAFIEADMQAFVLDQVFDAVVIFDALHHSLRERSVLQRAISVLRPGGKIVMCEQNHPDEDGAALLTHASAVRAMREYGTLEKGLGTRYLIRALFDSGFERATVFTTQSHYRTWLVARRPLAGTDADRSVHYASDLVNALWQYE